MQFISTHLRTLAKLYSFIFFLFLLHTLLGFVFVYKTSLSAEEGELTTFATRISKDLVYKNGKWDTRLYNADPLTPYPNGSSGFVRSLYIITKEGFVIERSQPIKGILDTSDFNHLVRFGSPTTLNSITNETWRILSKKITDGSITAGIVAVSYYSPRSEDLPYIDQRLEKTASEIIRTVSINNGRVDVSQIDIRNIHYEFSFEIVDTYNNVLLNNGRVPTFIDSSYFGREIEQKGNRVVRENGTNNPYLLHSRAVISEGKPVGVIVVGEHISGLYLTLKNFLFFSVGTSMLFVVPLVFYTFLMLRKEFSKLLTTQQNGDEKRTILRIAFDKKKSKLFINETIYDIPFSSNQYYVCDAIFANPKRRWEYDELLTRMGEDSGEANTRKVYDAAVAINKRIGVKLVEYKDKGFFMNPRYVTFLNK